MKSLVLCELERLWKRKLTWLFFLAIPLIVGATARYYMSVNADTTMDSPEYVTAWNFPVMALIEQLMVVVNIVSLVLLVLSFTEEYRTGQLRLVMLRAFTFGQLFRAKFAAYACTMGLFLAVYLGLAASMGVLLFEPVSASPLFYRDGLASGFEVLAYTLSYYGLAFATVLGVGGVLAAIAVWSPTTTAALGIGMGFLLASFGFPVIYAILNQAMQLHAPAEWEFASLLQIQYKGIAYILADAGLRPGEQGMWFYMGITVLYMAAGGGIAYASFTKKDRWV